MVLHACSTERSRTELNFLENQSEALKKNTIELVQQTAYDIIISCLSINKLINWAQLFEGRLALLTERPEVTE